MGAIRSCPENHINISSNNTSKYFKATLASTCGWQHLMQDYVFSYSCHHIHFLGILDGHGGPQVAQFCHNQLPSMLQKSQLLGMGQIQSGLQSVITTLDEQIVKKGSQVMEIQKKHQIPTGRQFLTRAGCSLVICAISEQNIIIGNIGNCKGYVCYKEDPTKAVLISGNHSLVTEEEQKRVQRAGGFFLHDKLNGIMPFTRSIGNLHFKNNPLLKKHQQLIVSIPSIFNLRRQDIQMVVLGSSGLWERPAYVLNHLMIKNTKEKNTLGVKERVGTLLEQMIATDSKANYGLQNMAVVFIELRDL